MCFNLEAALRDLGKVANRILELMEWEKLAQQEHRSPFPSALRPSDQLKDDIRAMYGWFISLDMSIHEVLSQPDLDVSLDKFKRWQHRLEAMEKRIHACGITDRFINP